MKNIKELFEYLQQGKLAAQDPRYHPEGNVYTHSLLTFWEALNKTHDIDIITAALFHDVGKIGKDYAVTHKHALLSERIVRGVLNEKQTWLIANHMRIGHYLRGEMKNITKRIELELHPWFEELKVLYACDRAARTLAGAAQIPQVEIVLREWFGRVYENSKAANVR